MEKIGATVNANETLNLNVGNDLIVESLRDEYTSKKKGKKGDWHLFPFPQMKY